MAITLGYHGCSKETAQKLLSGSSFLISDKPYDWLGAGAYFWENDVLRAYQWALERRSKSPCVVGAVIDLGNCLDLTTQRGIHAVQKAYQSYFTLQRKSGQHIPENQDAEHARPGDIVLRYLDRAVINHLHESYTRAKIRSSEFDTVRAMFPEGKPLYANAGFMEKTHVQIAVRKQNQVLGIFRVPDFQLMELSIPSLYNF